MKQQKKFTHNECVYHCTTHQKVGNSNYEKAVKIRYLGSVIMGWNAKNNTPMDEIIQQAKKAIDSPQRFVI
jgi:hypothetical protein